MNSEQTILVNRLKQLCREKNLTYYQLSHKSTVPLTTLIHIINGSTKNPGIVTILKLCEGLDVTLSEFFGTDEFAELIRGI